VKIFTLAAGLATGYVLGTRAGREKYEQIVAQYQKFTSHPSVVQAQEKTKQAVSSRASEVITKLDPTAPDSPAELPVSVPPARPARSARSSRRPAKSSTTTTGLAGDPLAGDPLAGDPLASDPLTRDPLA
jgi:hypothetical protein